MQYVQQSIIRKKEINHPHLGQEQKISRFYFFCNCLPLDGYQSDILRRAVVILHMCTLLQLLL